MRLNVNSTHQHRTDGFDFNKLFNLGVNYQRLSDMELLREVIDQRIVGSDSDTLLYKHEGELETSCHSIGSTSLIRLRELVRAVANFVELIRMA